jgi:hypothetical protein
VVAPGYAAARENPVNRTEGSTSRRGYSFERNMTDVI